MAAQCQERFVWITKQTALAWQDRLVALQQQLDCIRNDNKHALKLLIKADAKDRQLLRQAKHDEDHAETMVVTATDRQRELRTRVEQFIEGCSKNFGAQDDGGGWDQRKI